MGAGSGGEGSLTGGERVGYGSWVRVRVVGDWIWVVGYGWGWLGLGRGWAWSVKMTDRGFGRGKRWGGW